MEISTTVSESERKTHAEKWGGFNDLPSGWREIPFEEGLALLGEGWYQMREYRQPIWRVDGRGVGWGFLPTSYLHWLDSESGWAFTKEYVSGGDKDKKPNAGLPGHNRYIIKFYRFGCDHKMVYQTDTSVMFDHHYKCER